MRRDDALGSVQDLYIEILQELTKSRKLIPAGIDRIYQKKEANTRRDCKSLPKAGS